MQDLKLEIGDDPSSGDALHLLAGSRVVLEGCLLEVMANTAVYVVGAAVLPATSLAMRHCILGTRQLFSLPVPGTCTVFVSVALEAVLK